MKDQPQDERPSAPSTRPWQPMKIEYLGQIKELVRSGGGKITTAGGDNGDATKKPKGQKG